MKHQTNDPRMRALIARLLATCEWKLQPKGGRKHAKLVHASGRTLPYPTSGSDYRGFLNFRSTLKRLLKEIEDESKSKPGLD
ncbi:hypothetical protein V9W64_10695 [Neisseria leonii]|uniref:Uncharacterized protein n=1 Tax=Neisseria leonii TaxID=2995413 RepID=A0A9X4IF15_9NEIS|nr:hypothetical protein [Neisseria sp. 51.81]MDD9328797.1 hypothetical protein [Neisseria sp. 51.81]